MDQLKRTPRSAPAAKDAKVGPKRSQLVQERSRDTRQSIIKAALELWSERGYETGFDDTRADEIAARAGVAKATFYFHFARKDDILLEAGWITAKRSYEDALTTLARGGVTDEVIDELLINLSYRVEKSPRIAVRRMVQAQAMADPNTPRDQDHFGFQRAFLIIFIHAQEVGELPKTVSAQSIASMLEALAYAAIREWAYVDDVDLLGLLRERSSLVLAGARHVSTDNPPAKSPSKRKTG
ncbi:TetR/AcrR family transcriptional regulator [Jatrophihabitans sp. DSM 45814]